MIDIGGQRLFACDECPIVAELDYRLTNSKKYGHPFQFDHCACDKVYEEFWQYGYCEDAWVDRPKQPKKGKRKTGRAYRRQMRVQKFNRQKNLALNCNAPSLWLGINKSEPPTHKRHKSPRRKKFYKGYSNKVARRSDVALPKGNQYRKLFDLWWTVY